MHMQESLHRINYLTAIFVANIKCTTAMELTDSNLITENILIPLFKLVYGFEELVNLNIESANFPVIDLADKSRQVAIQVSSTVDLAKVKATLSKFFDYKLNKTYRRVIIYCLTDKQKTYAEKTIKTLIKNDDGFEFDINNDIQDYTDFLKDISNITDIEKVEEIRVLCEPQVPSA